MNSKILLGLLGVGAAVLVLGSKKEGAATSGSGGAPGLPSSPCESLRSAYDLAMKTYQSAVPALQIGAAESALATMQKAASAMASAGCANAPSIPNAAL